MGILTGATARNAPVVTLILFMGNGAHVLPAH